MPIALIKETSRHRTQSIDLQRGALVYRLDAGRTLALVVTIGLGLVIIGRLALGVTMRAGIAPQFYQQIALNTRTSW